MPSAGCHESRNKSILNRAMRYFHAILYALCLCTAISTVAMLNAECVWRVKRTADFDVDGLGTSGHWQLASWLKLPPCNASGAVRETSMKCLYSATGICFLFYC